MSSRIGRGRRAWLAGRLRAGRLRAGRGPAGRFRAVHGLAAALSLGIAAAGCSSMNVYSDFDPSNDFRSYRTWDWLPESDEQIADPRLQDAAVRGRIESALAEELLARGFRLSLENPDFFVAYHASLDSALEMQVVNEHYGYSYQGSYGSTWGPAVQGQTALPREFERGTLLVDVLDGRSRQLVWRGTVQAEVYPDLDEKKREERIREAARKVLGQFPPR